MTTALIIAGGVGSRMGADIPKQFVEVMGKSVLEWTLGNFQAHPLVDRIRLVLIDGWEDWLMERLGGEVGRVERGERVEEKVGVLRVVRCEKVPKLDAIVKGGGSAQESIRNGIFSLEGEMGEEDIVIIHDGVRPMVEVGVLDDIVAKAREFGDGVTSMPYNEQIFLVDKDDPATTKQYIPRETLRRVSTPQAYRFGLVDKAYHDAFEKKIGIYGSSYTNTMMVELGHALHFAAGSDRNIKLTTPGDLEIFKGMMGGGIRLKVEG